MMRERSVVEAVAVFWQDGIAHCITCGRHRLSFQARAAFVTPTACILYVFAELLRCVRRTSLLRETDKAEPPMVCYTLAWMPGRILTTAIR